MNKYLIKLADHLDKKGLHKEADYVDWILKQAKENELTKKEKNIAKRTHPKDELNRGDFLPKEVRDEINAKKPAKKSKSKSKKKK